MKEIESKLISTAWNMTRIRVRWRIKHGWLARLFMPALPKVDEMEADYVRDSKGWRTYPDAGRCSPAMAAELSAIAARLLEVPQ